MNEAIKSMILTALELKETSVKRAAKTAAPRFQPIYESELSDIAEARVWITKQKTT